MITTARAARFLQRLPDADAAALLDAVHTAAADPLANPRHCKHLAPRLYECRASLPPSRQYRLMFSYRPDGQPVLLSACLKTSLSTHEKAILAARAELASDESQGELLMAKNEAPFTVRGWIYTACGRQLRITHHTRRRVVVQTDDGPVELRRARLERDGIDHVNGITYRTTKYWLPCEAQEIAS